MINAGRNVTGSPEERLVSAQISRGVRRLLSATGYSSVCELPLPNGRRADVVAISASGHICIIEVKTSAADFRSDLKWPTDREYCDQFFFAVAKDGPVDLIPQNTGLILSDSYSGEIIRDAPIITLAPARRRSMLLAFARHAADRLHRLQDPRSIESGR
jgi:hypothetical protein